jgi:hypothetical protein
MNMHKAKAFFYVCAGLFLLALSFHLGQVTAQAQSGPTVEGASIESFELSAFPRATACVNRLWSWMGENGGLNQNPVPVPGSLRIVATDPYGTVMLENGDWLKFDGSSWVLVGNLAGGSGPVSTSKATWGQLKARYRDPVTPTQAER